jgi:hypothetical protein
MQSPTTHFGLCRRRHKPKRQIKSTFSAIIARSIPLASMRAHYTKVGQEDQLPLVLSKYVLNSKPQAGHLKNRVDLSLTGCISVSHFGQCLTRPAIQNPIGNPNKAEATATTPAIPYATESSRPRFFRITATTTAARAEQRHTTNIRDETFSNFKNFLNLASKHFLP